MEFKPLISVVIPTHNRSQVIGRAIKSVLNQTFRDFELIIVDDGSTDSTKEVVKSFSDDRIVYIKYEKNRGVAAARNIGIKASRGEYIGLQDSDDEWFPEKLEEIHKVILKRKFDFIFSYGTIIKNDKPMGYVGKSPWVNKSTEKELIIQIFRNNFIPTQGALIKKEKIMQVGGFDENLFSASDHDLWMRLIPICNLYFIGKSLFNLYLSENCITSNIKKRIECQLAIFKKNRNILKKSSESRIAFFLTKQIFLSNIYRAAAWDLFNRKNERINAFVYYIYAFIMFPYIKVIFADAKVLMKRT